MSRLVSETLVSLMAYGDEDDDEDEDAPAEAVTKGSKSLQGSKPFWAVWKYRRGVLVFFKC